VWSKLMFGGVLQHKWNVVESYGQDWQRVRDTTLSPNACHSRRLFGHRKMKPLCNGEELSLVLPRSRHQVFGDGIVSFVFQDLSTPTAGAHTCGLLRFWWSASHLPVCPEVVVKEMEENGIRKAYTFIKELGAGSFGTVWLVRVRLWL